MTEAPLPIVGDRVLLTDGRIGVIKVLPQAQTGPHAAYGEVYACGTPWGYHYYTIEHDSEGPVLFLRNHFTVLPPV